MNINARQPLWPTRRVSLAAPGGAVVVDITPHGHDDTERLKGMTPEERDEMYRAASSQAIQRIAAAGTCDRFNVFAGMPQPGGFFTERNAQAVIRDIPKVCFRIEFVSFERRPPWFTLEGGPGDQETMEYLRDVHDRIRRAFALPPRIVNPGYVEGINIRPGAINIAPSIGRNLVRRHQEIQRTRAEWRGRDVSWAPGGNTLRIGRQDDPPTRPGPTGGGRFADIIDGDAELAQFLDRCEQWADGVGCARSRASSAHNNDPKSVRIKVANCGKEEGATWV